MPGHSAGLSCEPPRSAPRPTGSPSALTRMDLLVVATQDLLITAFTGLAGALIGGGATVWSQAVTHRGTARREREARGHSFTVRRHELQLETLVAAQEALFEHFRRASEGFYSDPGIERITPEFLREMSVLEGKLMMLTGRMADRDAALAVVEYISAASVAGAVVSRSVDGDELTSSFVAAQTTLGTAVRADPFGS